MIELLEISSAKIVLVAGAGDHNHRPGVGSGVRETRKPVDTTGAGYGEEDTWAAGEVAVGRGGVASGLLVMESDKSDAKSDGAIGEGGHRDAHNAEHTIDAGACEGLGDQEVAVD